MNGISLPEGLEDAIAIVGMAARLPGGATLAEYWQAVAEGRDLVGPIPPERLADAFTDAERAGENYVPVRPALPDVDLFDAGFFRIVPREAALMDPQARVFLEICWEALEDAGCDPARAPGAVGVFAGSSLPTYFLNNVLRDRSAVEDYVSNYQLGDYLRCSGAQPDTLSTRVAFKLGLTGPAISMSTACSTSLVTIGAACQSLQLYQCDMALAGGVSITFPQERGYFYQEGGMVSRDGHCRPFDAEATGTVFGSGAGVVALRRLADAFADGDTIRAVIRGYGMNNDGADKIAFTAPSVAGQVAAIRQALAAAGVEPPDIGYVECHGTGTPLGDPIEFEGLRQVFADVPQGRVALGSAKANLGHLDAAAGVVGVIKAVLSLQARVVPPLANFTRPNPRIDLAESSFEVPVFARPWESDRPLRVGVSSFGVGGTNAHLVLEAAPELPPSSASGLSLLPLSARSEEALAKLAERLADRLEAPDAPALADVALTLQEGRHAFPVRRVVAAEAAPQAAALLRASCRPTRTGDKPPALVFLFPGQGVQYPGMGSGLYACEPVFAAAIDAGAEVLRPLIGRDIRDLLLAPDGDREAAARILRDTAITQPALFLIEYATAALWRARGVEPDVMIGHSVGEFVAAALAEVMDFETALSLIAARGRHMQDQARGAMLSVRAALEEVLPLLPAGVDLAAHNAPRLNVFAGPDGPVAALESALVAAGLPHSRLHTSHAFHSEMMEPAVAALEAEAARYPLRAPVRPYLSCVTGTWITESEAVDPRYWARHCRATVDFNAAALSLAHLERTCLLLEVGPGGTLGTFASQALPREKVAGVLRSLPDHSRSVADERAFAEAAGGLWSAGYLLDWAPFRDGPARKVSLPTYPFERSRHWIEAPTPLRRQIGEAPARADSDLIPPAHSLAAGSAASPAQAVADQMTEQPDRIPDLVARLLALLEDLSGDSFTPDDAGATFLELGFDSLLLGQVTQRLAREMGASLTFRQLLTDYPTVEALAAHLDASLPAEASPPAPVPVPVPASAPAPAATSSAPALPVAPAALPQAVGAVVAGPVAEGSTALMQMQTQAMLTLFENQLRMLGAQGASQAEPRPGDLRNPVAPLPVAAVQAAKPAPAPAVVGRPPVAAKEGGVESSRFDLDRRNQASSELTEAQRAFVAALCSDYSARFARSKARTQEHRALLADPRTASGFRSDWKELVFPIVAARSKGAIIEDVDGNRLVDLVNGFGQTAFGHAPDFVTQAVADQLAQGFAIGPQSPLAHEVARELAAVIGHERICFCNTGSEAVMAAMRLARTVTGRDTIVTFKNDYHGQFDEVLVKGRNGGDPTALPAVAGVPRASVGNMVVLSYAAPESLEWIRENADEIAGILVEPIQSRHPELRPKEFVAELRRVATGCGAALILDEVVTGLRVAPGGVQELWDIRADLATYGKVIGGGMPVGIVAGAARFMDALDGGFWRFGDDTMPEVPPTFFAGTFVRHPLVLAACRAVLEHLKGEGQALYRRVAPRTELLRDTLNDILEARGLPRAIEGYSSWLEVSLWKLDPRSSLLYPLMRLEGIHVLEGYPWFFTTAHGEAEFARVAEVFARSLDRLQAVGIMAPDGAGRPRSLPAVAAAPAAPSRVPLTEPQKEVWLAAQLGDAASGVFIESASIVFKGALDLDALRGALNDTVARHDALRMRFTRAGDAAEVLPEIRLALPVEETDEAGLAAMVEEDARTPFDLAEGPLVRARLARLSNDEHVLILACHHIVCDGWSGYILIEDVAAFYNARHAGGTAALSPPASFAAFAAAEAARPADGASADFWKTEMADPPEQPDLPADAPRPVRRSFSGATHVHLISAELTRALKRAGGRAGATLFATLGGTLASLIGRLSGADEVVLAVPTAGQTLLEDDRLVGHCVNLLPIRMKTGGAGTVAQHLRHVSKKVLDCFDHREMTYGTILRSLALPGDLNRQPLSEIQFNLDQQPSDFGFDGVSTSSYSNPRAYTNFDLIFNVTESPEGLRIDLTYNTDILSAETVARWCRGYETMLAAVAEDPERLVAELPVLSEAEAAALALLGAEAPLPAFASPARIEALVAAQVAERPGAVAVADASRTLTYAELSGESDGLAAEIRRLLPEPGARVAVLVPRSAEMLVALLAVLKAGHAYVPLDPGHPPARLGAVLQEAGLSAVVHRGLPPDLAIDPGLVLVDMDSPRPAEGIVPIVAGRPDDTAYVIFTSGSTGKPKGVEIPHGAVVNFLRSMAIEPGFSAADTLLSVTTVSFDIAVLELFLPLSTGGRVVIAAGEAVREAFPLVERLRKGDVTVLQATPTLWQMLLEAGFVPSPDIKVLVGGEPLPLDLAKRLVAGGDAVWNLYGPTETTIWSSCGRVGSGPIDIGRPIAGTEMHVLDTADRLVPAGVAGELNIGGAGLAKGYFGRPDLTEAAFRIVTLPGLGARRLYRTGDLAVRRPDGTIRLLGRRDGQVKLRGFRIELGDVEATMRQAPGVAAAAVALRSGAAGPQLVGYYVDDGAGADAAEILRALAASLPNYMVPSRLHRLDSLPRTPNGKLDRRALPEPDASVPGAPIRIVEPLRGPTEEKLHAIWSEVLGTSPISATATLFEIGADSLAVFRIAARMLERGLGLEARDLLQHPTIRALAAHADARGSDADDDRAAVPSLSAYRNGRRRAEALIQ
jgi:amino acid adenylation domain-containing protein